MIENLKNGVSYIISPYSHDDNSVIEQRVYQTEYFVSVMIGEKLTPLSPICSSHYVAKRFEIDGDFKTWQKVCIDLLSCCNRALILGIDGIEESKGARAEVRHCIDNGMEVYFSDFYNNLKGIRLMTEDELIKKFKI